MPDSTNPYPPTGPCDSGDGNQPGIGSGPRGGEGNVGGFPFNNRPDQPGGFNGGGSGGDKGVDGSSCPEDPCENDSGNPIRYANGMINLVQRDIISEGFGTTWGHTRTYCNTLDNNNWGDNGNSWFVEQMPILSAVGQNPSNANDATIVVIMQAAKARWFGDPTSGSYPPMFGGRDTLTHAGTEFTYMDTRGRVWKFYDFNAGAKAGRFKSYSDPGGTTATAHYNGSNQMDYLEWADGSDKRKLAYTYYTSGVNSGRIQYVTLIINTSTNVQRCEYTYYGSSETHGTLGDLKTVTLANWNGSNWNDEWGTTYYRYYKSGQTNGFAHALKFVIGPEAYARMVADSLTPETASDGKLAEYSDNYFEYDISKRVTKEVVYGSDGTNDQIYTYAYSSSAFADGYNSWETKTVETLPDGNQNIVYTNYAGQVMLKSFKSGTKEWVTYRKYDSNGRLINLVTPTATKKVGGKWYDDTQADLVNGTTYLQSSTGLIYVYSYYASTNVGAGEVEGYLESMSVRKGNSGTAVKVREWEYTSRTVSSKTIYPIDKVIDYQSDASGGSNPATTEYAYTWHTSSFQVEKKTTTWPAVTTAQNGSNSSTTREEVFNAYGQLKWIKDERGFITYFEYDLATGAMVMRIDDVDTTQVSNEPSGWTTPAGGGLHLVTDYEHDDLGRITQELGPVHDVSISGINTSIRSARWMVYKDTIQETWEGMGYQKTSDSSYALINPVTITKGDRAHRITDEIVSKRSSGSGKLSSSDTFNQTDWSRWRRFIFEDQSLMTIERLYHNIPSSGSGSATTNYYDTSYAYDSMRRLKDTTTPGGTLTRNTYHATGLIQEVEIGLSSNTTTLRTVAEYEYDSNDNGGIGGGDGNLTKLTQHVDASTTRVTTCGYDYRNRREYTDGEEDFYEDYTYDNLGRMTQIDRRNTSSGGNLVARSVTHYDNLGRVYQEDLVEVDPSTGATGNTLTSDMWYDATGNVIKSDQAGSQGFIKTSYDGVARVTAQYEAYNTTTDTYAEAGTITNDTVMRQTEYTYDKAGNVIKEITRERFDDATGTGALTTPGGSQPKARAYYVAKYPDAVGREQAMANYGTNGGSALSRAATVPSRSDTILVTSNEFNDRGELELVTDPEAVETKYTHDDAGRMTQQVEDNGAGKLNKTTNFEYNGDGRLIKLTAVNATTGNQETEWIYGTTLSDSDLASNDLLRAKEFPDGSSSDRVEYQYNRQGEVKQIEDQRGSIRALDYDDLGRLTQDRVTTLGTNVDSTIRRIARTYEVRGMLEKVTSYNNATVGSGTVINEVKLEYNDFGRLEKDWQDHDSVVGISSPKVTYGYASGSANTIRRTSITYPDGQVITHDYGTANAVNDRLSRVQSIKDGSTKLAEYTYMGLDRRVVVDYVSQPGVELTYIKLTGEADGPAGDKYTGLDRFGRVSDVRWVKGTSDLERVKFGFDRAGNRGWRENTVAASNQDEYYTYNNLYELKTLERGNLNGGHTGISGTPTWEEDFTFDATGNWTNYLTKVSGSTTLNQNRTHNVANEISTIAASSTYVGYDSAGNMTKCPRTNSWTTAYDLTYDAWNRLVRIRQGAATVGTYTYDGLNRRVTKVAGGSTRHYYYSDQWQILEERTGTSSCAERQFVWGLRYIDDLIVRDRSTSSSSSSSSCPAMDERLYVLHDYFSVTAVTNSSGTVLERYGYDAFGESRVMTSSFGSRATSSYDWDVRYGAYRWDSESDFYQVRNRYLHSALGRWLNRDPLGDPGFELMRNANPWGQTGSGMPAELTQGPNLYGYVSNNPINSIDTYGLWSFYKWIYTGDGNISDEIYYEALDEAADYVNCYKDCLKNENKCVVNWFGALGGSTVAHIGTPRPIANWIAGRNINTGHYFKSGIRAVGIRTKSKMWSGHARSFKKASRVGRAARIGVAGAAVLETGLAIKCANKCSSQ